MEKIKTPIMQNIERLEKSINFHKNKYEHAIDQVFKQSLWNITETLEIELEHNRSLLPTERDMIEKAHMGGQQRCTSKTSNHLSKHYFTQTFESYE